jgi:O-antigen ligase
MKTLTRKLLAEPLLLLAWLWPLVILAPHAPGLPRPALGGLPWRQELLLALLLSATLGLLWVRARRDRNPSATSVPRDGLLLILCGAPFVAWVWLSSLWAARPHAATHLAFQWSAYIVFFALMTRAAGRPRVLRASFISLGAVVWVLALACAVESWMGASLTDGNMRSGLKPLFRGSGGFGELMATAAPLFAALALRLGHRRRALLAGVTALLAWLATLQSLERAPLIGATAGLLLALTLMVFKPVCRPRRAARAWLLLGALAAVTVAQSMPSSSSDSPGSATSTVARLSGGVSEDVSTRVRFLFWGVGMEMLRAHPLRGVGANNYDASFSKARAEFAARHPESPLVGLNEQLLAVYAHNEYVQILAELGLTGLLLFALFALALADAFRRALRHTTAALPALGAGAGMLAMAISSGASASSYRYLGGGLVFFFAAAIIAGAAGARRIADGNAPSVRLTHRWRLAAVYCSLALTILMTYGFASRATGATLHALAQSNADPETSERLYRASLGWDASSAQTHYSFGSWLYAQGRAAEGLPHLRYAVSGGLNSSLCYAQLAGAETLAGDTEAAERTLAEAARAYPRSVFLRVRHAAALEKVGRQAEAEVEMHQALLLDSRAARGWHELIVNDIDAATAAALRDPVAIAPPGELEPEEAVFVVLDEHERRTPGVAHTGMRARVRSFNQR